MIHEADEAVRELNREVPGVMGLEALSRQLLRQESVASSRIEGLVMSHRRLAKAAIAGRVASTEFPEEAAAPALLTDPSSSRIDAFVRDYVETPGNV